MIKVPSEIYTVEKSPKKIQDSFWWDCPDSNVAGSIFATTRNLNLRWSANYASIKELFFRYEDKYFYNSANIGLSQFAKIPGNRILSLNVTASCIDTLVSKITQNDPSIAYVTNGADWKAQRQAKDLQKYAQGRFQAEKASQNFKMMLMDACISGSGLLHFKFKGDRVVMENIKPHEVIYDWVEAQYGDPQDIHIIKLISKFKLAEEYPDKVDIIKNAPLADQLYGLTPYNRSCVLMIESYNLYARRHTVTLQNGVLLDEVWQLEDGYGNPQLPIVLMNYKDACRQWYGIGIGEELRTIHDELNYMLRTAQEITHLCSVPVTYVPRSAGIIESQFDNSVGKLVYFDGMQIPVSSVLGEPPITLFQQIQNYFAWAYQIAGISEMSASSESPKHLDSGRAIQTMWQIESTRFATISKNYTNAVIKANELMINMSKVLAKHGVVQKANFYGMKLSKQIDFDEVNLDRDQFDIQAYPIDNLPNEPAGRLSYVQDLINLGFESPLSARRLLSLPDVEQENMYETSMTDYVMEQIYESVQGVNQLIHPYMDLNIAVPLITKAYFFYKNRGLEEEKLLVLQNFLDAAQAELAAQQQRNMVVQQAVTQIVQQNQQQQLGAA